MNKRKLFSIWGITDEEIYNSLKKKNKPDTLMDAEEWKSKRLKQLSQEGKLWSR